MICLKKTKHSLWAKSMSLTPSNLDRDHKKDGPEMTLLFVLQECARRGQGQGAWDTANHSDRMMVTCEDK